MEIERWKNLIFLGFPNYEVSTFGRVRNILTNKLFIGHLNRSDEKGYYRISLHSKEGEKRFAVHRLVALAFIPNTDNKPEIDHIDGNKRNNHYSNLKWVTRKENVNNPITREKAIEGTRKFTKSEEFRNDCSNRFSGEGNPMYGRVIMNNGKDQMTVYIPWDKDMLIFGWQYGRLKKNK